VLAAGGQVWSFIVKQKTNTTRARGPQALSDTLAKSVLFIVRDAMVDWLAGNHVAFEDVRVLVEQLLRDEFALIEERVRCQLRNAWHDEYQGELDLGEGV
jgi:hypothetical protein